MGVGPGRNRGIGLLVLDWLCDRFSGWWFQPLWKILISQLRWLFPIYGKIKTVPNHQSVFLVKATWIFVLITRQCGHQCAHHCHRPPSTVATEIHEHHEHAPNLVRCYFSSKLSLHLVGGFSPRGDVAEPKVTKSKVDGGDSMRRAAATKAEASGWEELRDDDKKSWENGTWVVGWWYVTKHGKKPRSTKALPKLLLTFGKLFWSRQNEMELERTWNCWATKIWSTITGWSF